MNTTPTQDLGHDAQTTAADYIARGWKVIPGEPFGKRPGTGRAWQQRTFTADDFVSMNNVAVQLGPVSGGLHEFDCDTTDTARVAWAMLGERTACFGRSANPRSHFVFIIEGESKRRHPLTGHGAAIDLRGSGSYTMFPGSRYRLDDGGIDNIRWENELPPMKVTPEEAARLHGLIATVTALLPYWVQGQRDPLGLALIGVMHRAGCTEAEMESAIRALAAEGREPKSPDELLRKLSTREADELPGLGYIAQLAGEAVAASLKKWLPLADNSVSDARRDEWMREVSRHAALAKGADGGMLFLWRASESDCWTAIRREQMRDELRINFDSPSPRMRRGNNIDCWLESNPTRYRGLVFAPGAGPVVDGFANTWSGYGLTDDDCAQDDEAVQWWQDHLLRTVCNGSRGKLMLLERCIAASFAPGGRKVRIAFLFRGAPSSGKSHLGEVLGRLVGEPHYAALAGNHALTGRFNADIDHKQVIFGDEAFYGGDKGNAGVLKAIVSEERLRIEPKGVNAYFTRNVALILMATNEDHAVPSWDRDRRFALYDCSDAVAEDAAYWQAFWNKMRPDRVWNCTLLGALLYHYRFDFGDLAAFDELAELRELRKVEPSMQEFARELAAHEHGPAAMARSLWRRDIEEGCIEGLVSVVPMDKGKDEEHDAGQAALEDKTSRPWPTGLLTTRRALYECYRQRAVDEGINLRSFDGWWQVVRKLLPESMRGHGERIRPGGRSSPKVRVLRVENLAACRAAYEQAVGQGSLDLPGDD